MSTSWLIMLVFFRLMVSPKSFQLWENLSMRHWSCCSVCNVTAASSAKSMSLVRASCSLVFPLSLAWLNSRPSDLVCWYTHSDEVPKARFKSREKIPMRVGSRTQGRILVSYRSDMLPSYCVVAFMSSWNDLIMLFSFGGHTTFRRMLTSLTLLTKERFGDGQTRQHAGLFLLSALL